MTAEDVNVVRTFKGDSAKYVAAVSRDGSLTVIMNIVQDDELRAMVRVGGNRVCCRHRLASVGRGSLWRVSRQRPGHHLCSTRPGRP